MNTQKKIFSEVWLDLTPSHKAQVLRIVWPEKPTDQARYKKIRRVIENTESLTIVDAQMLCKAIVKVSGEDYSMYDLVKEVQQTKTRKNDKSIKEN
jgi:hypothetical protein